MKKLNKLFAILIAVLGVQTLSAQTDVTSTYLTNAGFDDNSSWITGNVGQATTKATKGWTATSSGDTWWYGGAVNYGSSYTVNSVTPPAKNPDGNAEGGALGISAGWGCTVTYKQEVTLPAGVYTLSYKAYNANTGATQANNYIGFTSSAVTAYGKTTNFTANTWVEESVTFVLSSQTTGNISVGMGAISGGSGSNAKLFVDGVTLTYKPFTDVTEANPVDLTSRVSNTKAAWTGATETPGYDGVTMVAVYKSSDWTGDALSQTINGLPAGNYRMEAYCQAHSSWDTDAAAEGATGYTYLCANEYKLDVPIRNADGATTKQLHTFEKISITNGSLKISVVNEKKAANWISVYVKSLTFLGPDKSLEEANFNSNIEKLKALSKENLPDAFVTKINNLITTYENANASAMTLSELVAANEEIKSVIDLHPTITTAFSSLINLKQLCDTYASESYSSVEDESTRTAFNEVITTASTNGNKATTVEELTEVFNALEDARQDFILVAIPTTGNSYDMTFLIKNPSFETGDLTGWTVTASSDTGVKPNSNGTYTTTGVDGNYLFNTYWKGNPLTQEISGLPSGVYELKVLVASDGGTVYLTADDKHNEGIMTSDKTIFLESSIEFVCTDGNAVIGVVGGADGDAAAHKDFVADGYWWYKADNFRLYRSFDPSTAQKEVKDLKSSATALLSKPMNKEAKATFESKINSADETSDNPFELASMATMLNEAIAEAKVSITEYEKLKKYIDMTAVFTDVTSYTTKYNNGEYASTDVETTRQELNVMRFNAASAIYKNKVDVTGWTGSMGERSDQHWSGTAISYKDANSWDDIQDDALTTTVHLFKGSYVLKVAGRSATENARLTLEVLGNTIEFHAKGDTGYGIDTDGKANFSSEGTYANDGKGRGWEWEFLKFTLDEEQNVTLSVNSYYNNTWQVWNSFGDISLWMDEETFMAVYGEKLNEPLADAKAMVNTKPMGTAENNALVAAIELSNTFEKTPEGLNGAVDALTEAVANAKAWVADYNEAKVPLVAALERFEAELNEDNGCKYDVADDIWTLLLDEVKNAACAKDVTDDYSGFEDAAAALNEAMDNLHNWIKTNPTLNAKSATAVDMTSYYLVNASFDEGNTNGWTKTGSQTNGVDWSVTDGTFKATPSGSHYTGDAIWQKVNLPKGAFKLSVNVNAEEVKEHPSCLFAATSAPTWDNMVNGLLASAVVEEFGKDIKLTCVFKLDEPTEVFMGFNQKAGNRANTDIRGSYTIYDFTLTQAANQILEKDGVITVVGENEAADLADIYSDESIVTVDLTAATWNETASLNTENKNSLVYIADNADLTANNVVMNGVSESIVLTDGYKFYARESFVATELNYAREFSANWLTVCLPFAYEMPENVKVETLGAIDLATKTFTFDEVTGTMEANTPYIIKNSSDAAALFASLREVEVKATPNAMTKEVAVEGSEHKAEFIGTYTTVKTDALMEDGAYDILFFGTDGQLYYLSQGVTEKVVNIKPFRAYIRLPKGAINWSDGQQANVRHRNSEMTDIAPSTLNSQPSTVIYDLMGRKVNTMEKGAMYIVNGKKVVIK